MNDFLKMAIGEVPQYLMNLMELFTGPKEFLKTKLETPEGADSRDAFNRAMTFAAITLLVCFVLQIPLLPKEANVAVQFPITVAMEVLCFAVSVLAIRISWKVVGGTATLRELAIYTAYVSGPMAIMLVVSLLLDFGLVRFLRPHDFALLVNPPANAAAMDSEMASVVGIGLLIGFGASLCYSVIVQGAYRQINKTSRLRSVLAYLISIVVSLPLFVALFLLMALVAPNKA